MSCRTKDVEQFFPLILRLPVDTYFNVGGSDKHPELEMQAPSQAQVKAIRAGFPGTFWKKRYDETCKWWEYHSIFDSIALKIYAVDEGPLTCKKIVEIKKQIVHVAAQSAIEAHDEVRETSVVRWVCNDDDDVDSGS